MGSKILGTEAGKLDPRQRRDECWFFNPDGDQGQGWGQGEVGGRGGECKTCPYPVSMPISMCKIKYN